MPTIEYNYYPVVLQVGFDSSSPQPNMSPTALNTSNISNGANGTIMTGGTMQSPNFSPSASGWRIKSDGGAEFSNLKVIGSSTLGGWSVNATSIYTGTEDYSGYTANAGDMTIYSNGTDASIHAKNFYIDTAGNLTCASATVSGAITTGASSSIDGQYLTAASVTSTAANLALRGWTLTGIFSASDLNTVAWTAGTFTASDGTAYSIDAGNTGNMAAKTYVYLDIATSTTVLQITTTAATAVGNGKVLIAICENSTTEAVFQVFGGTGGLNIKGGSIEAGSITTSEIAANTIVAGNIAAGTITSTEIGATDLIAQHIIAPATFTAGEDLTAGDAAYFKVSDGKIWKADTDADESTYNFIGFVRTTEVAEQTDVQIITGGIITKAAWGLTAGSWYYLSGTAGAVSSTPGTRVLEVGIAITTTQLLIIQRKPRQASGTVTLTATNTSTITIGFRPNLVICFCRSSTLNTISYGYGDAGVNNCVFYSGTVVGSQQATAWYHKNSSAETVSGVVDTFTATGFRLNQSINNITGGSSQDIVWVAMG